MATVLGKEIDDLQGDDILGCDRGRLAADFEKLGELERRNLLIRIGDLTAAKQEDQEIERAGLDAMRQHVQDAKMARLQGIIEGLQAAGRNLAVAAEPAKPAGDPRGRTPWPELVPDFFDDNPGLSESTKTSHRQSFRELEALIGAKPVGDVSAEDIVRFAGYLRDRPNARGGLLALPAIKKLLQHVKSLFGWATAQRIIREDPSHGVQPRKMTVEERFADEEGAKRAFTEQELRLIFDSPVFIGCESASHRTKPGRVVIQDARYYFFLAAFLTGGRVSELPGATLVEMDGVLWFDMTKTATKNLASRRRVPVLEPLRRTGFVDWAREQERQGVRLFRGPDGSADWSKLGNRILADIGVKDPTVSMHSFRHTMRQMLTASGVDHLLVSRFLGHRTRRGDRGGDLKVTAAYGPGMSPDEARLVLREFKSPIALDHLSVRKRDEAEPTLPAA